MNPQEFMESLKRDRERQLNLARQHTELLQFVAWLEKISPLTAFDLLYRIPRRDDS